MIEEGGTPLYIVALAYEPIIWQLEGATARVEALVLPDHLGATGLPHERVAFLSGEPCQPDLFNDAVAKRRSMIRLENALGRAPDLIIEEGAAGRIVLPSGTLDTLEWGDDDETFMIRVGQTYIVSENPDRALGRFRALIVRTEDGEATRPLGHAINRMVGQYPGGLAAIAPVEVIAARPVEPYVVLPGPAGLIQLIEEGRLEAMEETDVYRIVAPIPRLPPDLYGADRATFFLAPGIAPPDAESAGHARVIDEATGDCVPGFSCD